MATTPPAIYDYIVVGGGTSGCVVASRLSEDHDVSVLLLEAGSTGSEAGDLLRVPGNLAATLGTKYDWDYKVLGGSSTINGLAYVRGHREDFDSWQSLGCDGWSWKDVLPYFQKFENFIGSESEKEEKAGTVTISNNLFGTTIASKYFIKAEVELGYENIDINNNNGQNIGFGDFPSTVDKKGERCSADVAYIQPVKNRLNLTILTDAMVTKVDIQNKRAIGVFAKVDEILQYFAARKEVILSGGTINSPQLLMLSGVGPREHLNQLMIPCIEDLLVGKNLQDHMDVHIKADVKPGSDVLTIERTIRESNQSEVAAFIQTKHENKSWPDLEVQPLSLFYAFGAMAPLLYPLKSPKFYPYFGFDKPITEFRNREGYTYQLILLHPHSRGEVRLGNADPFSYPIIDPHYLEDERDVDVLVEAIRFAKKISESSAMKPLEMQLVNLQMPDSPHPTWSDENLRDFVRHFAWTLYHPVGTCKMGRKTDVTAVVDPQLRVRGIEGLRVIDASIMPHLTSGNTMAPSYMIGEKGAELIRRTSSRL